MNVIRLGGEGAEFFTLAIHGRNRPESEDYWDGNWLWCTAEVAAGAFRGSVSDVIRNEDLIRFLPRLEDLDRRLEGEALLDTLEGWLDVRVIGVGHGQLEVRGSLRDAPLDGNQLDYRLALDQTFLPPLIGQVRGAVEAFRVRSAAGRPSGPVVRASRPGPADGFHSGSRLPPRGQGSHGGSGAEFGPAGCRAEVDRARPRRHDVSWADRGDFPIRGRIRDAGRIHRCRRPSPGWIPTSSRTMPGTTSTSGSSRWWPPSWAVSSGPGTSSRSTSTSTSTSWRRGPAG